LGGYPAPGKRRTRADVIRSASLHRLTTESIASLRETGITTIVDLRSTVERERDVTPDMSAHNVANVHLPVFESDASPSGLGENFPGFGPIYERFLENGGNAYRRLCEHIAASDGGVLFHCAAGKDRTG